MTMYSRFTSLFCAVVLVCCFAYAPCAALADEAVKVNGPEEVESIEEDVQEVEPSDVDSQEVEEGKEGDSRSESSGNDTDAIDQAILAIGRDLHELKYMLAPMELETSEATQYLPDGAASEISSYLIPFLWGIGAGLVAYIIGLCWRSAERLMGLVG